MTPLVSVFVTGYLTLSTIGPVFVWAENAVLGGIQWLLIHIGVDTVKLEERERLEDVRILADVSSVEVFLNNGEYVFTTRYYPEKACVCVETEAAEIKFNVIED